MLLLFTLLAPQGYCLVFCALGRFVCHIRRGGQVCVLYSQRWAGLGAISTEVGRFVCHIYKGGKVCVPYPQRWAGLCAISEEVGRCGCQIHRGGQVCVPYPRRWADLCAHRCHVCCLSALSTEMGRFVCHIHRVRQVWVAYSQLGFRRIGQVYRPYPQSWAGLAAISGEEDIAM
jgi:hypothetical protein